MKEGKKPLTDEEFKEKMFKDKIDSDKKFEDAKLKLSQIQR